MSLDELMGLTDILKTNGNLCFKINIVFPEGIFLGGVGLIHKKNSKPCENPFFGDCFWRPLTSHIGIWVQLVHCHVWHKTNSQHYHQAYSSRLTLNVLWVRANFIFWWWKICCHWEFKKKNQLALKSSLKRNPDIAWAEALSFESIFSSCGDYLEEQVFNFAKDLACLTEMETSSSEYTSVSLIHQDVWASVLLG